MHEKKNTARGQTARSRADVQSIQWPAGESACYCFDCSIDSLKVTKNKRINDRNNSSYIRFDNSPKPSSTLQLLPIAKPGITKDKRKDLKFFLQFLQPENQEWLSTVTMVGEQTLESNNMSDEESNFK